MEKKIMDLFAGTFLDGFFQLKESEYLKPSLEKGKNEVVIGKMSDAEKRVLTLISIQYGRVKKLSLKLGIDTNNLNKFLDSRDQDLFDYILEDTKFRYEVKNLEFPWHIWDVFLERIGNYQRLTDFLDNLIYTRLMPKYICTKPILRKGFLIVKDGFEVMEDDLWLKENEEKIMGQNYPFN